MDGDPLMDDLRDRLQRDATIRAVAWSMLLVVPAVATPSPVLTWLPIDVALIGLFVWRIVRAAAFLDRPQHIERVELDGGRKVRVVMTNRQRYTFGVPEERREAIVAAIEQRKHMVPARVVRR
jgi:hypothetical protein